VGRHPGGKARVVVHLQLVAVEVCDDQVLVVSDRRRVRREPPVKRDLGARATRCEVRPQSRVVGAWAVAAGGCED
jgi:hypothetical protein